MAGIREFTREDVGPVADLYGRAYWDRSPPAPEALRRYFEQIYFEHPWRDLDLPSYVHEDDDGQVVGFIAVFPRPMTFQGRSIRAGVLSTVMVDPRRRGRSIGSRLMERAFAGPQDLFFTDGANAASRKLWEAAGGEVCLLSSCQWMRVLRPSAHVLELARGRKSVRPIVPLLRPVSAVLDALAVRAPAGPTRLKATTAEGVEASAAEILSCIMQYQRHRALIPRYDLSTLSWLLREAAGATRRGRLETILVKGADGTAIGWYVYLAKSGGISEVLQLGGARETISDVLHHLFRRAWGQGSVAVRGQFEATSAAELAEAHCGFSFLDIGVLVHTRDVELARAIHSGNTALSRLDGEWWMHFSDGPWA